MPSFIFSVAVDEPKQIVISQIKCGFNRECTKGDIEIPLCMSEILAGGKPRRIESREGAIPSRKSCKTT